MGLFKIDSELRSYVYDITDSPVELPITLEEVKEFLKLSSDTNEDAVISIMIASAYNLFVEATDFILMKTGYRVYADCFYNIKKLYKYPFSSLSSYKYLKEGVFTDVDSSLYYIDTASSAPVIILKAGASYPTDVDVISQSILIEFVAGKFEAAVEITSNYFDIKLGLLALVAFLYENRGDCDSSFSSSAISLLPEAFKLVVGKYNKNLMWFL